MLFDRTRPVVRRLHYDKLDAIEMYYFTRRLGGPKLINGSTWYAILDVDFDVHDIDMPMAQREYRWSRSSGSQTSAHATLATFVPTSRKVRGRYNALLRRRDDALRAALGRDR